MGYSFPARVQTPSGRRPSAMALAAEMLMSDQPPAELLLWGARGTGKTAMAFGLFSLFVGRGFGPELEGYLIRRTYPQLEGIAKFGFSFFGGMPGVRCNRSPGRQEVVFPGEETLKFRAIPGDGDIGRVLGSSIAIIIIDELTTYQTPDIIANLRTVMRSGNPDLPLLILSTTNPFGDEKDAAGCGVEWVKRRYVDGAKAALVYQHGPGRNSTRAHLPVTPYDNPALLEANPYYWVEMDQSFADHPQKREGWGKGTWPKGYAGAFGDLLNDDVHFFPDPIAAGIGGPKKGRLFRALDWGKSDAWAYILYWIPTAKSGPLMLPDGPRRFPVGSMVILDELYGIDESTGEGLGMTPEQVAARIRDREDGIGWGVKVEPGPGDIITEGDFTRRAFAEAGVPLIPWKKPNGSRSQGFRVFRTALLNSTEEPSEVKKIPPLYISDRCRHTRRTIPLLMVQTGVDDIHVPPYRQGQRKAVEDHLYDAIRYALMHAIKLQRGQSRGRGAGVLHG